MSERDSGRDPLVLAVEAADLKAGERVLDLSGRGGAVAVSAAAAAAASVEALQPDDEHAEEGRRLARSLGLENVFFHVGPRHHLPFDAGQFDVVLLCGALARERRPIATLREARRVLAVSGRVLVQEALAFDDAALDLPIWEAERCRDAEHVLYYTRESLALLLHAAGLEATDEIRSVMTQDSRYWAGVDEGAALVAEVKRAFFSLPIPLQERLDLALADGIVSFSYPLVTVRASIR